jgi:hypothetical protein
MSDLKRAAAYAIKPNELQRCGPADAYRRLHDFVRGDFKDEAAIREILRGFEVAYPYYTLIARANGIEDAFDERVVEAYWLGNELLDKVSPEAVHQLIEADVVREGWSKTQIALMFGAIALQKALPHHSLSVLYFLTRPGSRMILPEDIKTRADACRVCWGQVLGLTVAALTVAYRPLVFDDNWGITLGPTIDKQIEWGLLTDVAVGDTVAFHLNWGVEKLTGRQAAHLDKYTRLTLQALGV